MRGIVCGLPPSSYSVLTRYRCWVSRLVLQCFRTLPIRDLPKTASVRGDFTGSLTFCRIFPTRLARQFLWPRQLARQVNCKSTAQEGTSNRP